MITILSLLIIPYQNCSNQFSAAGESSGTSTGASTNTGAGTNNGENTNQDQLNRVACSKNFNDPSMNMNNTEVTINSGMATDNGDSATSAITQITVGTARNIINASVNSSIICDRYTTISTVCNILDNDSARPINITNAIDQQGNNVVGVLTQAQIAGRSLAVNNCNNMAFNLQNTNLSSSFRLALNRANNNNNTFLRCVQGSLWVRIRVQHTVDANPEVNKFSPYQYIKVNLNNNCLKEDRLKASADFPKSAGVGSAVAIDGNWAVAIAPNENMASVLNAGAAHVFNLVNGSWLYHSTLQFPNAQADDTLTSVALKGDTLILGSSLRSYKGAVYVYKLSNGRWNYQSQIGEIVSPDNQPSQLFGYSLAYNGTKLVVGAPHFTRSGSSRNGKVYIFNGTTFAFEKAIQKSGADIDTENRGFGMSVAIDGNTIAVGAPQAITKESLGSGQVLIYTLVNGEWAETSIKKGPTPEGNSQVGLRFGHSVSLVSGKLLVGAPGYNSNQLLNAGAAYYYANVTDADSAARRIVIGATAGANFGNSVVIAGTGILIGVPFRDNRFGAVCYIKNANINTANACDSRIFPTNASSNDAFGWAVAVSGMDVISGAYTKGDPLQASGAAFVHRLK